MGILDIVLLVCFIPAIVEGISKGFVKQVISTISIIIGAWAAFHFSSMVSTWLVRYITIDPRILNILAFSIVVILSILLLYWVGELITKIIKISALGWLNTILGIIFGIVKAALILGLLIMVFEGIDAKFGIIKPGSLDDANVYQVLRECAHKVFPYLKSFVTGAAANV